jgi:hypothetical protein
MNKSDIDFLTNEITLEKDKAIEESQKELGCMNGFSNGVNYLYKKIITLFGKIKMDEEAAENGQDSNEIFSREIQKDRDQRSSY